MAVKRYVADLYQSSDIADAIQKACIDQARNAPVTDVDIRRVEDGHAVGPAVNSRDVLLYEQQQRGNALSDKFNPMYHHAKRVIGIRGGYDIRDTFVHIDEFIPGGNLLIVGRRDGIDQTREELEAVLGIKLAEYPGRGLVTETPREALDRILGEHRERIMELALEERARVVKAALVPR